MPRTHAFGVVALEARRSVIGSSPIRSVPLVRRPRLRAVRPVTAVPRSLRLVGSCGGFAATVTVMAGNLAADLVRP